jgi:hypothetical protein
LWWFIQESLRHILASFSAQPGIQKAARRSQGETSKPVRPERSEGFDGPQSVRGDPEPVEGSNHEPERKNDLTPTHTPPADSRRIAKHKGITAADEVFIARRFCAHKAQSGDAQSVADGNSFYARAASHRRFMRLSDLSRH